MTQQRTKRYTAIKNRSTRRPGRLFFIVMTLVVILTVVMALTVFFKVHRISVVGNVQNSEKEIIEVSNIETGKNLVFMDLGHVSDRITEAFPYVKNVKIRKILPDKIQIQITEREPVGIVENGGVLWVIDEEGKILESFAKSESSGAPELPRIFGVASGTLEVGQYYQPEDEMMDMFHPVLSVLQALRNQGLSEQVTSIRINHSFQVNINYQGKYQIKLQMPCDIEDKIEFLTIGLNAIDSEETGIIDLTVDKVFRFIPQSVIDMEEELAKMETVGEETQTEGEEESEEDSEE